MSHALSMRVVATLIGLVLALCTVAPAFAAPEDGVHIGELRAHLFYQRSGVLSEDLIARKPRFNGWNTAIGEGDAKEPSENLLVVATLVNPGDETFLNEKVILRVTDEMDELVKVKEYNGLLLSDKGTLQLPMWLDSAECLGPITISATFRDKTATGTLDLLCGT